MGSVAVALAYTVTCKRPRGIEFDLVLGVFPPSVAVIFGTEKDLLRVGVFWKKYDSTLPRTENHTDILSTIPASFSIADTESHGTSHAV
ncbi:hypothetical protein C0995_000198 [Termitomyces sp. Mi166|nr:hypothetical protein C0995_000198 [Termitomyces sp. Mi166\